jgi:DtxR family transcriptional regulator, Mn-dependent transcriptional regulator
MLLAEDREARTDHTDTWKRFAEKEVTHSMAHYLQAIASLKRMKGYAKVSDIADILAVSRAGVTSMLRSLKGRGLVVHERYGLVELTEEGERFAKLTERNREVLAQFFTDILGLGPETAHEDACMIEHLVSPASMVQFLRLTALIQSDHPAAAQFRAVYKDYQERCESGGDCPVCEGRCLKEEFEDPAPAPDPDGRRKKP